MIIIPIGIDCTTARVLRKFGLRKQAYPFDWNVLFLGVSRIFAKDFNFIPSMNGYINNMITKDGICFHHDKFPVDIVKYERRIKRLKTVMNGNDELIFLRKSHTNTNHGKSILCNDMEDVMQLNTVLLKKYNRLKYTIILIQMCSICFNAIKYINIPNIKLYNACYIKGAAGNQEFDDAFDTLFIKIFKDDYHLMEGKYENCFD